ncbi:RadC-like JAB domain-containing protein [Arenibacter nanhaiticus]|uniref:RadC-like JAB domain-containing protein n=1 Tax=Arenibacter nanhaiticus TaxID=558155 RepID=A0A1M6L9Z6_9FLAO|nr:JAB domain-containing protein [Arenibacter nanhaiticus]SHJ68038.1 RadC-like JAB domain-containing protein [Arenibacter nanhaiticus]
MEDIRIATFKDFVGELTAIYRRTALPTIKIDTSRSVREFIYPFFEQIMDDHEEVKIIHLNRKNQVVNVHHLSSGTDSGCLISIKDILRQAILIKTSCLVLVHNHPSGNLTPSEADKHISNKLSEASKLLDIATLDSIIITREGYFSFADEGLL